MAQVVSCLASLPTVSRAWVFGSRATGTARDDSDLDIGVELDPHDGDVLSEWIVMAQTWRDRLNAAVGGAPYIHLELAHPVLAAGRVWPAIREHGVLIYDARGNG